jgi:heme peroxidase
MNTPNRYTRMFPELARPPSTPHSKLEKGLEELGRKMTDDDQKERHTVTAGYTYLGQFIDHDLTLDLTPLDRAHPEAELTQNFRTPFLDLDHVYGGGPTLSPFLYHSNQAEHGKERFLIGKIRNNNELEEDLPRNPEGIALVGDPRQDENVIIAQLHVAFLKFHNLVLHHLEHGKMKSVGPVGTTLFEQARRLVTWHYQYIVLNDFLQALIDSTVFEKAKRRCSSPPSIGLGHFRIPIEFSVAAFRFGHSMVRDSYDYSQCHPDASLGELLDRTGAGTPGNVPLPEDWIIEWYHFFFLRRPPRNDAREINTKIAMGLHNLPRATIKLFNAPSPTPVPHQELPLPVRTLWRGARVGLPSGQDVARTLAITPLDSDREIATGSHRDVLIEYGFHEDTPLWYYILKEAEILGKGHSLGPIGSRIVANVVVDALHADANSYVSISPDWKPMLGGEAAGTIGSLLSFIKHG